MKFGKYLLKRHLDLPEYADHFMDYKALKKLIKRLSADPQVALTPTDPNRTTDANNDQPRLNRGTVDPHKRLQENKATFFFQLERELEKVQQFYERKESDLEARLELLIQRERVAEQSTMVISRTSVTYISLHEGLLRFRRELGRLEQFVELNATAFSKVLKKWDKRSRSHTKELYLTRAVEVQPMFHREILVALSDKSSALLLELEAMTSGESAVVYAPSGSHSDHLTDSSMSSAATTTLRTSHQKPSASGGDVAAASYDDLFFEFVTFASSYDPSVPGAKVAMDGWISDLQVAENPQERITAVFLRAIGTNATEDSLMALLDTGNVDLSSVDEIAGKNALHLCAGAEQDRKRVFCACLDTGVINVNQVDSYARTPLHLAAIHKRWHCLTLLLKHGAHVNLLDYDNYTALHYSIFEDSIECVEALLDAGAQTTGMDTERYYVPLNFACQRGSYNSVKCLLTKRGSDPMVADAEGLFPLHIVARAGFATLVPLLVHVHKDVDGLDKLNGWTALMYAAAEGHASVVKALLDVGANWTVLDENGRSALFYAALRGHPVCVKLLSDKLSPGTADISRVLAAQHHHHGDDFVPSLADMDLQQSSEEPVDTLDLDKIPDLSLPPPILPLQRYGHNFLDSKKIILQTAGITLHFNEDRKILSAGRLVLTTTGTADDWIPRNLTLPLQDRDQVQTFQTQSLEGFGINFEILPTFGTRLLAKASALSYNFTDAINASATGGPQRCELPLVDVLLRPVGSLEFRFMVVKPYPGKPLEISKYDTYWKSTASATIAPTSTATTASNTPQAGAIGSSNGVAGGGGGGSLAPASEAATTLSYVTASSLHGTYYQIPVVVTRDLVPVVMDMTCNINGVSLAVPGFTLEDLRKLVPGEGAVRTLAEVLADPRTPQELELHVLFLTPAEFEVGMQVPVRWPAMNTYVDEILHTTFDYARQARHAPREIRSHSLLFTSSNPEVCAMLNWKQPNYPVLFCVNAMRTDGFYTTANQVVVSESDPHEAPVCVSLEEAAHYAAINNLMGITAPADLLRLVPSAVPAVRALGLVLIATTPDSDKSNTDPVEGADGMQVGRILTLTENIAM